MNNTFTEQNSYRNNDQHSLALQSRFQYENNQTSLKKALEILDSQPSQQISIHRNQDPLSLEDKMAAYKDMGLENLCNDLDSNKASCPFSQIETFQRQSQVNNMKLSYGGLKSFGIEYQQDHQGIIMGQGNLLPHSSENNQLQESAFDLRKNHAPIFQTPIKLRNSLNLHTSHSLEVTKFGIDMDYDMKEENQDLERVQTANQNYNQMAPNFIIKLQQSRSYQQNSSLHHSYHFQQPSNLLLEQNNRVMIGSYSERNDSFMTPVKQQGQIAHNKKLGALTGVKTVNSAKKSQIQNLRNIQKSIMPIHVINQKTSKSKILDFQKLRLKKSHNKSGTTCKINRGNISENFDQKGLQGNNDYLHQSADHHFNENDDENMRDHEKFQYDQIKSKTVTKSRNKKKTFNKTAPSIQQSQSEAFIEAIRSFRSTLSVQAYEIKYLNSLDHFNHNYQENKKQSLSLQGNYDWFEQRLMQMNQQQENFGQSIIAEEIHQTDQQFIRPHNLRGHSSKMREKTAQISENQCQSDHKKFEKATYSTQSKNMLQKQVTFQENRLQCKTQQDTNGLYANQINNIADSNNSSNQQASSQDNQKEFITSSQESANSELFISSQSQDTFTNIKQMPFQLSQHNLQASSQSQVDKRVKCNCQKNNCTQGYCDCLKNGQACDPSVCQCLSCQNTVQNYTLRSEIQDKKAKQGNKDGGCSCKQSQCQKRYCECFQNGRQCDPSKCRCQDCKNNMPHSHKEQQFITQSKY